MSELRIIRDRLQCFLCKDILNDPHSLDCRHHFCRKCIEEHMKHKQHLGCPLCHVPTRPNEISRNPMLQNIVTAWNALQAEQGRSAIQDNEAFSSNQGQEVCAEGPDLLSTQDIDGYLQRIREQKADLEECMGSFLEASLQARTERDENPDNVNFAVEDESVDENEVEDSQPNALSALGSNPDIAGSFWKLHSSEKRVVIAATCLSRSELRTVRKACSKLKGSFQNSFYNSGDLGSTFVTHLITKAEPPPAEALRCKRTAKYMLALAEGIYILDISWVSASLSARTWVNEEEYEMIGDIHCNAVGKPKQSRIERLETHQQNRLFSTFQFLLFTDSFAFDIKSLALVISRFGGQLVSAFGEHQLESTTRQRVGLMPKNTLPEIAQQLYQTFYIPIVYITWIVDSISSLQLLSYDDYYPY